MSFIVEEKKFGRYPVVEIRNKISGESAVIALMGATLLSYNLPAGSDFFNIIDGFADENELAAARGARSWIMIPFANRIPDGKYIFNGRSYQLKPVAPRTQVIHGFASLRDFNVSSVKTAEDSAEVMFELKDIRPGLYEGYPFSIDIYIKYIFSPGILMLEVTVENIDDNPAPFGTGWHPYFRTNNAGIENLIFTLNAGKIIRLDDHYIPLDGGQAYASLKEFPELDFNEYIPAEKRKINSRVLDHCYSDLAKDTDGISRCSLFDPENGRKIELFQEGGVTLAFSGDSLSQRKRKSVALEPMQFITNAFNRKELMDDVMVKPGEKNHFKFGVVVSQE